MKKYVLKTKKNIDSSKFIIDYKKELNEQQFRAVTTINGAELVIAGAGTGKTRTLVYRVAYLIENGIDPTSILLLTFTRKSANEMMKRSSTILDRRCSMVCGGTFHSFANMTLRKYASKLGYSSNFSIIDRADAEDIINLLRSELGYSSKEKRFPKKRVIMDIISKSINTARMREDIIYDEYEQFSEFKDAIDDIAKNYQKYKFLRSLMDYDDLLVNLKNLLSSNNEIKRKLSKQYQYIMIDEYQDTNPIQDDIAELLCSEHNNIMVVGDDSQSIYSFRGADFKNIIDFPKKFKKCKIITIEENYRSIQSILDLTNNVIENAEEKFTKKLFSKNKSNKLPVYLSVRNSFEQSEFICQRILELYEQGIAFSDIAILARSSWHMNELEISFKRNNIPYIKYGGIRFTESAHIKDILSFLRIIYNISDTVSWHRALSLIEGIGPKTAQKIAVDIVAKGYDALISKKIIKRKYSDKLKKLFAIIQKINLNYEKPYDILKEFIKFYLPILENKYDDHSRRKNDIESLVEISDKYTKLQDFLTDMCLDPLEDNSRDIYHDEDGTISLTTIHSAKGLEWHTVFIINLTDGCLPSYRSFDSKEKLEEERRLFYVALTRAKRNLYLIKPENGMFNRSYLSNEQDFSSDSRFVKEIIDFEDFTETWQLDSEYE